MAVSCAVLNSKNELLVGERMNIPDAWQAPQGGVDDAWEGNNNKAETIVGAASRELFEEMGLRTSKDVIVVSDTIGTPSIEPIRYEAKGNDNWLIKNGFSGQELHWIIFRCANARGDSDPKFMCSLEGQNDEAPEFSKVEWKPIDWVVEQIWPAKRDAYEALRESLSDAVKQWEEQCNKAIAFDGTWSRDASKNEGVVHALIQRGVAPDKAASEAERSYVQKWEKKEGDVWNVRTYGAGNNLRRNVDYQVGKTWREEFSGTAVIFGDVKDGLSRTTSLIAEPDADYLVAFATITDIQGRGVEESTRYLKEGQMVLKRAFWPEGSSSGVNCKEVFVRNQESIL
ncbi:MAG: hypothetical protein SGBAC_009166 [Bacillariaceae sp.]